MAMSGVDFLIPQFAKPSDVIMDILYQDKYGLLEVFPGMKDKGNVQMKQLIPGNDVAVNLYKKQIFPP